MKLNNVIVWVADMSRSVAFYREMLGFSVKEEGETYTSLHTDGVALSLHLSDAPGTITNSANYPPGQAELEFVVDDLHGLIDRLRESGVEVTEAQMLEGLPDDMRSFVRDPDGLSIQLVQLAS